jgi:hypothetical protein
MSPVSRLESETIQTSGNYYVDLRKEHLTHILTPVTWLLQDQATMFP